MALHVKIRQLFSFVEPDRWNSRKNRDVLQHILFKRLELKLYSHIKVVHKYAANLCHLFTSTRAAVTTYPNITTVTLIENITFYEWIYWGRTCITFFKYKNIYVLKLIQNILLLSPIILFYFELIAIFFLLQNGKHINLIPLK